MVKVSNCVRQVVSHPIMNKPDIEQLSKIISRNLDGYIGDTTTQEICNNIAANVYQIIISQIVVTAKESEDKLFIKITLPEWLIGYVSEYEYKDNTD